MGPQCDHKGLAKRFDTDRRRGSNVITEAEERVVLLQTQECEGHQKLEEARNGFSPESLWKECGPAGSLIPAGDADLRLPASSSVRESVSAVLATPFCGNLSEQPQETNTNDNTIKILIRE